MKKLNAGLSGCKLEFIDNNQIRKYSSSPEYNIRLSNQIDKQVLFSNFILKNIDAPKIYSVYKNEIYSFDMEYISGLSFIDYFSMSNASDVNFVIQTLFSYFDFLISSSKTYRINNQVLEKLNSLERDTKYKKYISYLKENLSNQTIFAPKSFCHGDLTFTNILFHKNRLFFIDFLDSYVDSFICDLVKLKQDLYYFWSLKVQKVDSLRIRQIYKFIWNSLYQRYSSYIDSECFQILDTLNSLRIEPYLTNQYQRDILYKMIENSNLYEKFNCTNGREII